LYNCKIHYDFGCIVTCNECKHDYVTTQLKNVKNGCRCPKECHKDGQMLNNYHRLCKDNKWDINNSYYNTRATIDARCSTCGICVNMKKSKIRENKIVNTNVLTNWIISCNTCAYNYKLSNYDVLELYKKRFFKTFDYHLLKHYMYCKC
jgi:hypothetical protein